MTQEKSPADIQVDKFISENPELEQIIPNEFRDEINQLLVDFSSLLERQGS